MAMKFEMFTNHYILQWLKSMGSGSAFIPPLVCSIGGPLVYSQTLPGGKSQSHVDSLTYLSTDPPMPPDETALHLNTPSHEEAIRDVASAFMQPLC